MLYVDDLQIDLKARSVTRDGNVLDLPDLSYRLLLSLVSHAPHRVSKDQLIKEVWQGTVVSDETLAQRIRLLRQVLNETSQHPKYIASVRNQGYRLLANVSESNRVKTKAPAKPILKSLFGLAALLLLGTAIVFSNSFFNQPSLTNGAGPTVAVLPFADLSPDGDNRYFSDGIHEELLSRLSQVENFGVVSRTSVLPFRATELAIPEIAQQLGVSNILEGSVRLMDNRVRITAQLIDGESDRHLWSESFERELTIQNLFAIQAEIATYIAQALEVELSGSDRSRLVRLPTENLEAYNAYLLGRFHTFRQTTDSLFQAEAFLQQAITIDDKFAEAWATLGWAYSFQGTSYGGVSPDVIYPKAKEAALRALALNSNLADARSLYADILTWYDWDWTAAEREYQSTLALDPNNVLGYALFLSIQLRHAEAIELVDNLINRFPGIEYYHINAAWRFLNARQYQRAIEQADLATGHTDYRGVKGWALLSIGQLQAALALFEQDTSESPLDPTRISNLAVASIRAGNTIKGQLLLDKLLAMSETQFVPPSALAAIYFEQNNPDAGFKWLQRALQSRSRAMIFLQVDHAYDNYRTDSRYLELISALGFAKP